MHSTAFDAYLMLLDPNGVPLAENDDSTTGVTDSKITMTLTATGTWTVVANSLAPSQTGSYTLSLSCPSTTVAPRQRAVRPH
jgi:serine protease Do